MHCGTNPTGRNDPRSRLDDAFPDYDTEPVMAFSATLNVRQRPRAPLAPLVQGARLTFARSRHTIPPARVNLPRGSRSSFRPGRCSGWLAARLKMRAAKVSQDREKNGMEELFKRLPEARRPYRGGNRLTNLHSEPTHPMHGLPLWPRSGLIRRGLLREAIQPEPRCSANLPPQPLPLRFCVPERLNCGVVHKNNAFFLHNRLRLGRHHKLIISLTHLPALGLDGF